MKAFGSPQLTIVTNSISAAVTPHAHAGTRAANPRPFRASAASAATSAMTRYGVEVVVNLLSNVDGSSISVTIDVEPLMVDARKNTQATHVRWKVARTTTTRMTPDLRTRSGIRASTGCSRCSTAR